MKKAVFVFTLAAMILFVACSEKKSENKTTLNDADTAQTDDSASDSDLIPQDSEVILDEDVVKNDDAADSDSVEDKDITTDTDTPAPLFKIEAGIGIGAVKLGMDYAEVKKTLKSEGIPIVYNRMALATFPDQNLELFFASKESSTLSEDGRLIAIGTQKGGNYDFKVKLGMKRSEVLKVVSEVGEDVGKYIYFQSGFSLEFDAADSVSAIGVFAPYKLRLVAPEMEKCKTTKPLKK